MEKEKTDSQKQYYYKRIAKRSFDTFFNQYLFFKVSRGLQDKICCEDFKTFEVNQEIIDEYVNEYWQKDYLYSKEDKWVSTIKGIETNIFNWKKQYNNTQVFKDCEDHYIRHRFKGIYPFEEFTNLLRVKTCFYCGLSEDIISELVSRNKIFKKKVSRGWTLEIDRKKPNLEYTPENCVKCCYWCNSAKTDEFDDSEFIPIGEAIKQIWHDRINR